MNTVFSVTKPQPFFIAKASHFPPAAPYTKKKLNNSYTTFVSKVYHPMKWSVCSPNRLKVCCQHSLVGPEVLTSADKAPLG